MNQDPDQEKLEAMAARIHQAEERGHIVDEAQEPVQPMTVSGIGFDFVGAVIVCGFLGWLADHFLGTKPWGIVGMLIVGFAIGITNVWRSLSDQKGD